MTSESPLGDSSEVTEAASAAPEAADEIEDDEPVPEDESEIPPLSDEPDNEPIDAPLPEIPDLDQDPDGMDIPATNKHKE